MGFAYFSKEIEDEVDNIISKNTRLLMCLCIIFKIV
jgi:hypothetical protein